MKKLISLIFFTLFSFMLFSQEVIKSLIIISAGQNISETENAWLPDSVKDELEEKLQTYTDFQIISSNDKEIFDLQKKYEALQFDENSAIELGKLVSANNAIFVTTRKTENNYFVIAEFTDLSSGKLIAKSISSPKSSVNEICNIEDSAVSEIAVDLCNKLNIKLKDENLTINVENANSYISLINIETGIKVTITDIGKVKNWTNGDVYIMENDIALPVRYGLRRNGKILLNQNNKTMTFIYPFVTKNKKYTFTITDTQGNITESKSIKADKTSKLQINYDKLEQNLMDMKINYTVTKKSRIISITKNPKDIFDGKTSLNLPYLTFYLNLSGISNNNNWNWICNFGTSDNEINTLITSGIDLMDKKNISNLQKSPNEIRLELNKYSNFALNATLEFSTEPFSQSKGSFYIQPYAPVIYSW